MLTLDAEEQQVAGAHKRGLRKCQQREERIATEVELVQARVAKGLDVGLIDIGLEHGRQDDTRDPNRKRGIERSHRAAVVLDVIHGLAVEGHRRGEGVGEGRRVGTDELAHAVEVA